MPHIEVCDLAGLEVTSGNGQAGSSAERLPSALDHLDQIVPGEAGEAVVFLDYDGTLTPIVPYPEDAVLSDAMCATLRQLAGLCKVAVLSGRDIGDIRQRVGLHEIWYAGSHGFDIAGPGMVQRQFQQGIEYLPVLDTAEEKLRGELAGIEGCLVERKHLSVATHYRNVTVEDVPVVRRVVQQVRSMHPGLRLLEGKKVHELQPDIDWDKGKAVRWMMHALGMDPNRIDPIYIGDDTTDENVFRELSGHGTGIVVASRVRRSRAAYRLDHSAEVGEFLGRYADVLQRRRL